MMCEDNDDGADHSSEFSSLNTSINSVKLGQAPACIKMLL